MKSLYASPISSTEIFQRLGEEFSDARINPTNQLEALRHLHAVAERAGQLAERIERRFNNHDTSKHIYSWVSGKLKELHRTVRASRGEKEAAAVTICAESDARGVMGAQLLELLNMANIQVYPGRDGPAVRPADKGMLRGLSNLCKNLK